MTESQKEFQPDDQDLPEGWEPDSDLDARWSTISTLLREADKPTPLDRALLTALHLDLRNKLRSEGLISESRSGSGKSDSSFREWLGQVFFGGGAPGQVVRLGLACGVAFFIGFGFQGDSSADGDRVAAATTTIPQPTLTEVAQAPPTGEGAPQPTGRLARGATDPESNEGWETTAPGGGWIYHHSMQPRAVTVSTAQASPRFEGGVSPLSEIIDQVQILKLHSMVTQDEQGLAEIRRLERAIASLTDNVEAANTPQVRAVEMFQRAEHAAAAQRFDDALRHFESARTLAPGSALAFLCEFQSGRISYEILQDYAAALESFRRCLKSYPDSIVTGQRRAYLEHRVQLLQETSADGWESLRSWQAADQASTSASAVPQLLQVIRISSSPTLLADASRQLADHVIRDTKHGTLNATEISNVISRRLATLGDGYAPARMGFSLGEIYARSFQDYPRALAEYRAALERGPDKSLEGALRLRISQMLDERLTGLSPID